MRLLENGRLLNIGKPHVPIDQVDMRTIEHSLCEWDKYERVSLGAR